MAWQEVCQYTEFSWEEFEKGMVSTHKYQVQAREFMWKIGDLVLIVVNNCGTSRVQANPHYNCHWPPQRVGAMMFFDAGVGQVYLPAYEAILGIKGISSHQREHGHMYEVHYWNT